MSDNNLVKTLMDAATLTGFAAGIGWIAKKVANENFTSDPSNSAMNYVNSKQMKDHRSNVLNLSS